MCIVSNVSDIYSPRFEPWFPQDVPNPAKPHTSPTVTFTPALVSPQLTPEDIKTLKALIAEFGEMMDAAKKLDILLKQPDCVDPEKAKLEGRVAELEKALKKLGRGKPAKRPAKKRA